LFLFCYWLVGSIGVAQYLEFAANPLLVRREAYDCGKARAIAQRLKKLSSRLFFAG
jgi:hypothetical protein